MARAAHHLLCRGTTPGGALKPSGCRGSTAADTAAAPARTASRAANAVRMMISRCLWRLAPDLKMRRPAQLEKRSPDSGAFREGTHLSS